MADHRRNKNLKLAETSILLQEQNMNEIASRNKMILFSSGPGGANSYMAKANFCQKQEDSMRKFESKCLKAYRLEVASNPEPILMKPTTKITTQSMITTIRTKTLKTIRTMTRIIIQANKTKSIDHRTYTKCDK